MPDLRRLSFVFAMLVASCGAAGLCYSLLAEDSPAKKEKSKPVYRAADRPHGKELEIRWTLIENASDGSGHRARWKLTNHGGFPLPAKGWAIYFNMLQLIHAPLPVDRTGQVQFEHISGDFYRLIPTAKFTGLPVEGSVAFEYEGGRPLIKESWAPEGVYIVFNKPDGSEETPELIGKYTVDPLVIPDQIGRGPKDLTPIPTAEYQYRVNEKLGYVEHGEITPKPVSYKPGKEMVKLPKGWKIHYQEELANEAKHLAKMMDDCWGPLKQEVSTQGGSQVILLKTGPVQVGSVTREKGSEAYTLSVNAAKGIVITGSDPAGVFYGVQSLLGLFSPGAFTGETSAIQIPEVEIADAPRFAYRGMHVDISHNFHSHESIHRMLDRMAFYKLNKLHLHLSDDEGWRIEIPELPELTEISSTRGHTTTHEGRLHPTYGASPFPDSKTSNGNGFISRAQFIDILKHAKALHVDVIPEIDMPGHSRGALIAMKVREKRLMAAGKPQEAVEFRLHDPDDTTKYESVQGFFDNTVCPAQESVYHFAETVIDSISKMYKEADAPLTMFHIGCDEVPRGVWTKSPLCEKLIAERPELEKVADLKSYFIRRINTILQARGLKTAAWQEAALDHVRVGDEVVDKPISEFANGQVIPYVWNNLRGNEDLCNKFANMGYPTVLSCVSNLYFDLAYNKDPLESGLDWGGFVDTKQAFEFVPEDVFKSTRIDSHGYPYDTEALYRDRESLTPAGWKNVLGIQGQIWCETVKGGERLEYYCFPKLLGLAERAWSPQPEWAKIKDVTARDKAFETAWNEFANRMGRNELYRLDYMFGGTAYRLPLPGAIIENGQLKANVEYPGLEIRYTTDGSDPTKESPEYREPVPVAGTVKLATFDRRGRSGRVVTVK